MTIDQLRRGSPRSSWTARPAVPDECIDSNVHPDHQEPQRYLEAGREPHWVECRQDVVVDEPARIAKLPSSKAQRLLPGGQGADPAGELDEGTPCRRRKMDPAEGRSPEDEDAPRHHEEDEGEMDEDEKVSKQSKDHDGKAGQEGRRLVVILIVQQLPVRNKVDLWGSSPQRATRSTPQDISSRHRCPRRFICRGTLFTWARR